MIVYFPFGDCVHFRIIVKGSKSSEAMLVPWPSVGSAPHDAGIVMQMRRAVTETRPVCRPCSAICRESFGATNIEQEPTVAITQINPDKPIKSLTWFIPEHVILP